MRNAASFPKRWVPAVSCKNADFLEQRKLGILFDGDVDHHKALRLAILPLMHSEKLALLAPAMNHSTSKLCQLLEKAADAGRTVDIHKMLGSLTLDVISSVVCGKDMGALDADLAERHLSTASDYASVFEHFEPVSGGGQVNDAYAAVMMVTPSALHPLLHLLSKWWPSHGVVILEAADQRVKQESRWLLAEHKKTEAAPDDDNKVPTLISTLTSAVLKLKEYPARQLTDNETLAQMHTFLLAGYETTSSALAHTIFFMARDALVTITALAEVDAFAAAAAGREPTAEDVASSFSFLTACLDESLRLRPPGSAMVRECVAPTVVEGFTIPARTNCIVYLTPIHRDAEYFPDPLTYMPSRFLDGEQISHRHPNAFSPFGAGPLSCIGGRLARQEMVLVLAGLFTKFSFQLEPGQNPLPNREGLTNVPAAGVRVRVLRRY